MTYEPNEPPSIRLAQEGDLEGILELMRDLHDEAPPPHPLELWREILSNSSLRHYVVEKDGQLLGTCHLVIVPNMTRGGKPYAWIENVVTRQGYRNMGIGKRLLRHAIEDAWRLGCYKVMLMTGRTSEEVLRFYESAGFESGVKTAFLASRR